MFYRLNLNLQLFNLVFTNDVVKIQYCKVMNDESKYISGKYNIQYRKSIDSYTPIQNTIMEITGAAKIMQYILT